MERYTLFYGLSADPVHQGHVDVVVGAVDTLIRRNYNIVQVILVPVYRRNPVGRNLKNDLPATYERRFTMCELAVEEIVKRLEGKQCQVKVSRIAEELAKRSNGPNFEVDTLLALQTGEAAGTRIISLICADIVSGDHPELGRWHKTERLVQLATIAIGRRHGYQLNEAFLKDLEQKGARFIRLDELTAVDTAGTVIRERLRKGEDPIVLGQEGLLPLSVAQYLHGDFVQR